MAINQIQRRPFVRVEDSIAKKDLDDICKFLEDKGLHFYELSERNMGSQRYIDVKISLKVS